jgi:hypothetical protein
MAKALLLRTEVDQIFSEKKLEFREPGFSKDAEKFYIGGLLANIHIPNETFVATMISIALSTHGPTFGTTAVLIEGHKNNTFAFNTDTNKLLLKVGETPVAIPTRGELATAEQTSVVVSAANIDAGDGHVLLVDFTRPTKMIFVDGILCSNEGTASKRYTFDSQTNELKVYGCVEGSVISHF